MLLLAEAGRSTVLAHVCRLLLPGRLRSDGSGIAGVVWETLQLSGSILVPFMLLLLPGLLLVLVLLQLCGREHDASTVCSSAYIRQQLSDARTLWATTVNSNCCVQVLSLLLVEWCIHDMTKLAMQDANLT